MRSMAIERRRFLGATLAGLLWPPALAQTEPTPRPLYLSARKSADGRFHVSGFSPAGLQHFDLPLPGRGHSFAVRTDSPMAVHFARRPGRFARVLDLRAGEAALDIETPADRHFYGHGAFSPDGSLLYATENDYAAGRGVIGVYDARTGFRRIGELPSHGIGPHDVRLLSDGNTLAVANGGIATRPDLPRVKLNLPTMAPSLVYIDRRDGSLLEEVMLPRRLHRLSIRHLAVGEGDLVALAMQYEGPASDSVPLVGLHRRGGPPTLLEAPPAVQRRMKQYCGSASFDADGRVLGISAPRGNRLVFWDGRDGRFLSSAVLADGCGIAQADGVGRFLASSGRGGLVAVDAYNGEVEPMRDGFSEQGLWDNHLLVSLT